MRLKNGKGKNMRLIDADVLKQHIDKLPALPDGNFAGNHSALKALINMQPTIEPEQRWIPCSERLPEESGRYQVTRYDYVANTEFIDILWYEENLWWNRHSTGDYAVTAWMPLPEPYKERREE